MLPGQSAKVVLRLLYVVPVAVAVAFFAYAYVDTGDLRNSAAAALAVLLMACAAVVTIGMGFVALDQMARTIARLVRFLRAHLGEALIVAGVFIVALAVFDRRDDGSQVAIAAGAAATASGALALRAKTRT